MIQTLSLFSGVKGLEQAQEAFEDLNRGKRGHYNKVPKPKHTENNWEYMRALYAHLADFFDVPRFQLKEDEELLFAGGRIKAWCFKYSEDDDELREEESTGI